MEDHEHLFLRICKITLGFTRNIWNGKSANAPPEAYNRASESYYLHELGGHIMHVINY